MRGGDVGQEHDLIGDVLSSTPLVSTPELDQGHVLDAQDLESGAYEGTPDLGQEHALIGDALQSGSELQTPDLGQEHVLQSDSLRSGAQLDTPTVGQGHVLTADDVNSSSQLSTPESQQGHNLLADDLRSGSELSTPTAVHIHDLTAEDLQSGVQVSSPELGQTQILLADDLQSDFKISTPEIGDYFQRVVPSGTVTAQNWTNELGSTANLHLSIDEIPDPDESDYIQSVINPNLTSGGPFFDLSIVVPTPLTNADQTLRFRLALEENTTEPMLFSYALIEGSNPRVTGSELVTTDVPYTYTHVLTQAEKDSIVSYDALQLQFSAKVN